MLGPSRASWDSPVGRHMAMLVRMTVLASTIGMMLPGAWGNSVTVVELAQLPAGLAAWQSRAVGIYRVCGPLSKLFYALPAYLAGVRVSYPASFDTDVTSRHEWELGQLLQLQRPKQYHEIYRWSRLLPILLTVLGGCLVCEWSTRLFGTWPGIVSLCVWCWQSPVLGHGSLVTSDMPSAVLMLFSARTFWSFLIRPAPATAFLAGVVLGLAQATKFTLLVLDPCWMVILFLRALRPPDVVGDDCPGRFGGLLPLVVLGFGILGLSIVVIDASYGFRDVGFTLAQWRTGQSSLADSLNGLAHYSATSWLLRVPLPIPLEFLRGIDFQLADTERLQSAYLLGRTQFGGWWYWYAAAFLLKVPLPALALMVLAIVRLPTAWRSREPVFWASLCVLMPAAEVALTISATTGTGTNAAFRYLLPSLGLLCVVAGCSWNPMSEFRRVGIVGLLAWLVLDAIAAVPDHVGAQNEAAWVGSRFAGRPALIGDSLDWGQDLARLSEWVSSHARGGSTLVCVHGLGVGEPYGLKPPRALPSQELVPHAAYLAVSEEILHGDRISNVVRIAGANPTLAPELAKRLQSLRPFDRVGRTIRIYRLRDLPPASFGPGATQFVSTGIRSATPPAFGLSR
ncbi:hypothetical protein SAMN05444166_7352 [Singulisphaera sp. GP187]|uniref:hypothetical protein n=1 Tax=Singulisphaera sp. GP187 TaxID=1882752 RepID=UPI00092C68AB|nr:hypothetical protein [Singulisphaera sp. GP187]SIO64669.1 hypothetical protein SAMN05444166_7352 [Singulisphaera sp. GP187]